MSQNSKSADIDASKIVTSTDSVKSKSKRKSSDTEELSKDFKKPRKSLKQLTIQTTPQPKVVEVESSDPVPSRTTKCLVTEDTTVTRVIAMLERVIDRQEVAQASIDRLLDMCLQVEPEDSSQEEGIVEPRNSSDQWLKRKTSSRK